MIGGGLLSTYSSLIHFVAPPLQITTAALGCDLVFGKPFGLVIYSVLPLQKERHDICRVFLFGFRSPWSLHPSEIKVLGRNTPGRPLLPFHGNSPSEFDLAEILGPLGLRIYGALAPRPRRAVLFDASILSHHYTELSPIFEQTFRKSDFYFQKITTDHTHVLTALFTSDGFDVIMSSARKE